MTAAAPANTSSDDAAAAEKAWASLRDAGDIQFAPVPPDPAPVVPEWLKAIGRFLDWLLSPFGQMLGVNWGWIEMALLISAGLGVAWIAWALLWPMWRDRKGRIKAVAPDWTPAREEALALLEDADRLAAEGRYDEAAHLLLQRSIGQIARARPDWLSPSSTAREIGAIMALPQSARHAFAEIAGLVERARYALRRLNAEDWSAARAAYARFALERLEVAA
ncbi:hypothetical protein IP81_15240 [Novosphingobium sp. AAP83]|nr:hypothetical protein IP81_15240 [Novosphingobium sp. AAP83]